MRIKLVQQISVKAFHVFVRSEIVLMKMTYLVAFRRPPWLSTTLCLTIIKYKLIQFFTTTFKQFQEFFASNSTISKLFNSVCPRKPFGPWNVSSVTSALSSSLLCVLVWVPKKPYARTRSSQFSHARILRSSANVSVGLSRAPRMHSIWTAGRACIVTALLLSVPTAAWSTNRFSIPQLFETTFE